METLRISLVQTELQWENSQVNRNKFSAILKELSAKTDLVILPEMFSTGFSMNAKNLAENSNGETLQWMQAQAKTYQTAITGSIIVEENQKFYNRLYFVFPDGTYKQYDKKHLFTLAGEEKVYSPGSEKLIVTYKGWKICPLICYDLRFPVWSRNTEDYDLLLYVANWPEKRVMAWDALLKARAIENMCYVAGVNRIGVDGNNHPYSGHSAVYDALGNKRSQEDKETAFTETLSLDKDELLETRKRFAFLNDRDKFSLK